MSVYKMDPQKTLQFVRLYKESECLWNMHLPAYKDRNARDQALGRISEAMNIVGFGPREVAQKIRNLRTMFRQEEQKISKCIQAGFSPEDIYKPRIPWFPLMDSFLGVNQNTSTQLQESNNTIRNTSIIEIKSEILSDESLGDESSVHSFVQETNTTRDSSVEEVVPSKRMRLEQDIDTSRPVVTSVSSCAYDTRQIERNKEEDVTEFDLWARSIAKQLNDMEVSRALSLQLQIQTIVSKERMEYERGKREQLSECSAAIEFQQFSPRDPEANSLSNCLHR